MGDNAVLGASCLAGEPDAPINTCFEPEPATVGAAATDLRHPAAGSTRKRPPARESRSLLIGSNRYVLLLPVTVEYRLV